MAEPSLTPTRLRSLIACLVVGGAVTFVALTALTAFSLAVPQIPWTTPALLLAAAAGGGVMARATHVRNHVNRRPVEPQASVVTLAVARAMLVGGSLLVGGYLACALFFLPRFEAAAPRERVIRSLLSAVAAAAVVVAGWFTERACRAPRPPDSDLNEDPS